MANLGLVYVNIHVLKVGGLMFERLAYFGQGPYSFVLCMHIILLCSVPSKILIRVSQCLLLSSVNVNYGIKFLQLYCSEKCRGPLWQ